ncbi:Uu.00g042330.m01.CDS01 [Anthostomella pinea]|uniref:Uu.00g042330.m01.CDS01 n=1 Tax=Anthostomella pinea TaxID=933095 RepID=A0AAI8VAK1_9PEZI|nr:Uu.00g042330.m01.CDS01 [Anthostomella pinea]
MCGALCNGSDPPLDISSRPIKLVVARDGYQPDVRPVGRAYQDRDGDDARRGALRQLLGRPQDDPRALRAAGLPATEAGYNGDPPFCSGRRAYMTQRTAMHEIAHTRRGTTAAFDALAAGSDWARAMPLLRSFDGADAAITSGRGHFWPCGLNYETKWSETSPGRSLVICTPALRARIRSMDDTLPSPPFIDIPKLDNFRDAGGYPVASQPGKVVRQGLIFRSAEPSKVAEEAIAMLQALGITHVYDLRSALDLDMSRERGNPHPAKEWPGAERVSVPVFRDQDYTAETQALRDANFGDGEEGFVRAYMGILEAGTSADNTARPFATILAHLTSGPDPTPLLIHCSAGKDRTGIICAFILSLCGVDDEIVAHEYGLTNLGLKSIQAEILVNLLNLPGFRDNPDGARAMVGARRESMLGFLKAIREKYGSVEACVLELGLLTPDGVAQLRHNLIVDAEEKSSID